MLCTFAVLRAEWLYHKDNQRTMARCRCQRTMTTEAKSTLALFCRGDLRPAFSDETLCGADLNPDRVDG
jgi:hypothetical protein